MEGQGSASGVWALAGSGSQDSVGGIQVLPPSHTHTPQQGLAIRRHPYPSLSWMALPVAKRLRACV